MLPPLQASMQVSRPPTVACNSSQVHFKGHPKPVPQPGPASSAAEQTPVLSSHQKQQPQPEVQTKKPLQQHVVTRCQRPTDNDYDATDFGEGQQGQDAWLQIVKQCLCKLADVGSEEEMQSILLTVPWAWLARDLIHLLPSSSCYCCFLEDDDLFCHFLQQLTTHSMEELSQPGARVMASILSDLAGQGQDVLPEYIQASPAILQRVQEVCTALCNYDEDDKAVGYAVIIAGCFLTRHGAASAVHNVSKPVQQALIAALDMLRVLPSHLQSSACTQLMDSQQVFLPLFMKLTTKPGPLGQSQFIYAVRLLERQHKRPRKLITKEAGDVRQWAVWEAQPSCSPQQMVKMIELAYHASQLLQQTEICKRELPAKKLSPIRKYIKLMLQVCQPEKLKARMSDAAEEDDAYAVSMVSWVALLVSKQKTCQAVNDLDVRKIHKYLLEVGSTMRLDAVDAQSVQGMSAALEKLSPGKAAHKSHHMSPKDPDSIPSTPRGQDAATNKQDGPPMKPADDTGT